MTVRRIDSGLRDEAFLRPRETVAVAELSTAVRRDRTDLRRAGLAIDSVVFLTTAERALRRVVTVDAMMRVRKKTDRIVEQD